jgi:serine/threonine protein kinase
MAVQPPSAKAIFDEAVELPSPAERQAYLDQACAGAPELRLKVEALLKAYEQAGSFLEQPAVADQIVTVDNVPLSEGPSTVIGSYKLLEQIGEGGFGIVFMAEQQRPVRRKVALKVLKPGMDTRQVVARFEAERQALALMDHPYIAHVFDGGETASGRPYFVMELVRGIPVTDFCNQNHLSIPQRLELFIGVCHAMQHAHQKGIIHRDLKPSNVLVTLHDDKPVVKVIDFGIAKAIGQRLTEKTLFTGFAQMIGTPLYMSPEQAHMSGLDIDTRSDVYALGVLLYELLTCSTPFDRERLRTAGIDEVCRIIREEEPPRPSMRISTLGHAAATLVTNCGTDLKRLGQIFRGELDWIVMKALEKDRNRRYEAASAFAADVQRFLHNEPVLACPPSAAYKFRKFARKNRTLLATAAAFVVLLLTATGVSIGLAAWALQARQGETVQRELAQKNEKQAKQSEAEARSVLQYFQTAVFEAGRPKGQKGGLGPDVTLRQAIDAAVPAITQAFQDQPLVEASIRDTLGLSYWILTEHELAIKQFERALALRKSGLGSDHPDTLKTANNLAQALADSGKLDQALQLLQETLRLQRARLGPDHPQTLITHNNVAETSFLAGKHEEGLALHAETLRLKKAKLGPDDPSTLTSMNNLAQAYRRVGKTEEAIVLLDETHRLLQAKQGPDHPHTLGCLINLAGVYREAEKWDRALLLHEEAFQRARATLGLNHTTTMVSMANLARSYRQAGKLDLALSHYKEALELFRARLGPEHASTLTTMDGLATTLKEAGQLNQALPLYEEVLRLRKTRLGADHPDTLLSLNNMALAYQEDGKLNQALPLFQESAAGLEKRRFQSSISGRVVNNLIDCHEELKQLDQAETWRRKWLAEIKKRSGTNSLPYAAELAALGLNLIQQKKWTDAELVLRASLAVRLAKEPEAFTTSETQSLLGGSLAGRQKFAEAEPLLLEGYAGMKARAAKMPAGIRVRLTAARERLVQLYEDWGKPSEAAQWRTKTD